MHDTLHTWGYGQAFTRDRATWAAIGPGRPHTVNILTELTEHLPFIRFFRLLLFNDLIMIHEAFFYIR